MKQEEINVLLKASEMPDCKEDFILEVEGNIKTLLVEIEKYKKGADTELQRKIIVSNFLEVRKIPLQKRTEEIIIGS
ncbi:MAG: hypothetical protein WC909_01800 [Candidatus Paceibacterota bacterium]|jgi:DNA replication initiation complex subunit (GINS family)